MNTGVRNVAGALALSAAVWVCLPGSARAQEVPAARPWKILIFHAFRPRVLSLCQNAHEWSNFHALAMPDPADPFKSRWLDEAAEFRWASGSTTQAGRAPLQQQLLTDACFTLFIEDVPVMSGAVVSSQSERPLAFPTITAELSELGEPLKLTVLSRFPAGQGEPAPLPWAGLFVKAR